MQISHLVVNGCSWTYCQGLDDPKTQGWPALVAEEFNLPVVNLAQTGSGNDGIHRRTYEYVFEDVINNNHPFYIIAWSQTWRREAWCKKYYDTRYPFNGYNIISFPNDKPTNSLEYALLDTWSEEDFYRKTVLYRLSLDCLFKSKNIEYMSSFFATEEFNMGKNECKDDINNFKERFISTIDYLKHNSNRVVDFLTMGEPYPKTSCGHYGKEGNRAIADYLIKEIKMKYNNVEVLNEKYLTLKEYLKKTDLNELHSHWM
jgi:hypothetical protein